MQYGYDPYYAAIYTDRIKHPILGWISIGDKVSVSFKKEWLEVDRIQITEFPVTQEELADISSWSFVLWDEQIEDNIYVTVKEITNLKKMLNMQRETVPMMPPGDTAAAAAKLFLEQTQGNIEAAAQLLSVHL